MAVPMVKVRQMRVAVAYRFVAVPMRVRLGTLVALMGVAVMHVVNMAVVMLDGLVHVFMLVPFGQRDPRAKSRQGERYSERGRERFTQQRDRDRCA